MYGQKKDKNDVPKRKREQPEAKEGQKEGKTKKNKQSKKADYSYWPFGPHIHPWGDILDPEYFEELVLKQINETVDNEEPLVSEQEEESEAPIYDPDGCPFPLSNPFSELWAPGLSNEQRSGLIK